MKKYLLPVSISLILGISMAYFIIRQYETMPTLAVSSEAETLYYIQRGVYQDMNTMNDNMNDFKGALAENYVCSSLVQCGLTPYYWESNGKAEVDFVVQDKNGNIIPIEVKSSIHTRSKSLNVFKGLYKIPYSIL